LFAVGSPFLGFLRRVQKIAPGRAGKEAPISVSMDTSGLSDTEIVRRYREECSWPDSYHSTLAAVCALVRPRSVLEVGVAFGYSAELFLSLAPDVTYVGVDPYLAGYDDGDPFAATVAMLFGTSEKNAMDRLWQVVRDRFSAEYPERALLLRGDLTSLSALRGAGQPFDFVYLDGDHREAAVSRDISIVWPLLAAGGALLADDYGWPGVRAALGKFLEGRASYSVVLRSPDNDHEQFLVVKK
jgi:predicted O-methyltransferase YrrM